MKRLVYRRFALIVTILLSSIGNGVDAKSAHDIIPSIATIGGITVGKDTDTILKKRFGADGISVEGQHPMGGLAWYVHNLGLLVNSDGFNDSHDGEIIDSFSLSTGDHGPYPRKMVTHASARRLAFMGMILPGMRRENVLRKLKILLPPPQVTHDEFWTGPGLVALSWDMAGKAGHDHYGHPYFTDWTAKLLFDHNKLVEIDVKCY